MSSQLLPKLGGSVDVTGNPIVDLGVFQQRWNDGFNYAFVDEAELTERERAIFARTRDIIALQGSYPRNVKAIRISEAMRVDASGTDTVAGSWEPIAGEIVIRRDHLKTLPRWAGTLLHEVTHATSDTEDVSREFEHALTGTLGAVAARHL